MKQKNGKVIVGCSAVQGNGCKYILTNLAHYCKLANTERKVALVDFDFMIPTLAEAISNDDKIHGIDNLIDKIDSGFLTHDLFEENMVELKDGVKLLKGTQLIRNNTIFNRKHIETIIENLRALYDYVFISVSSEHSNAGFVYSMFEADEVLLICRNNASNLKMLNNSLAMINHYKHSERKINVLYNMYNENSNVDLATMLSKHSNIKVVGFIKYDEGTIDNIDLKNGLTFKMFKGKNKNNEIYENILNDIMKE